MPLSSLYQFILLRYYKLALASSSDEGGNKSDSSNGSTCSIQTSIYKKCQNNAKFVLLECILTTWYRHCHHINYQCKYSMEKHKRGSNKKERNRMVEEEPLMVTEVRTPVYPFEVPQVVIGIIVRWRRKQVRTPEEKEKICKHHN